MYTKHKPQNMTFPIIKSFDNEGLFFVRLLRNMTVGIYEHLGIISWDKNDKMWMLFKQS